MNVRFPGLGLEFELRRWPFEVFGFPIYWYGIIISLGFLTAVLLALRNSRKYRIDPDTVLDMVLVAAPAAIIFARIYYVIFSWDQYKDNLIDIFKIRDGGLAIYGAVIGALLAAWLYTRKKKLSFLHIADFCIPYLVLGQAIGRWGNFVNQEAFGTKTDLPWRMNGTEPDKYLLGEGVADLNKYGVHPTFLYESLLDFAIFFILLYFRKKKKLNGEVLSLYLILYGAGRFAIEGLRTDSLMLGPFRVSQLLSAILVLIFVPLFIYRRTGGKRKKEERERVVLGQSNYGTLLMKIKEQEEREREEQEQEEEAREETHEEKSLEEEDQEKMEKDEQAQEAEEIEEQEKEEKEEKKKEEKPQEEQVHEEENEKAQEGQE
ncbi:MAG: prolipoprotein diacylglyceryl transferase [Bacillota bacterium]